jgi:TonB-dependent SusC/RagA subfamily outer membrane receptor
MKLYKLYRIIKRIIFQLPVLITFSLCIFLFSGQIDLFASQEFSFPATVYQGRTVKGTVTDNTGVPIPGVNVVIKGTTTGVVTSSDGNFSITVPNDNTVLVFSFVGYMKYEVLVGNQTEVSLTMKEDSQQIEEVVVTGYGGTRSRAKLTNSISSVKEETFNVGVYANPAQALSGAVSGLRVIQNSGDPMATPSIVLRGGTNLDGTGSPYILVDGMVRGSLRDINPADIESIEVLKDAGATALYGARANNGVILVTTKSGKAGRTEIAVNAKVGLNYLNNQYKMMNARDYLYWIRNGYKNAAQVWQDQSGNWTGYGSLATLTSATSYGTGNLYWDPANPNTPLDGNIDTRAVWSPMILSDNNRFLLSEGWQTMTDPVYGDEIIFKEFDMEKAAFRSPAVTQDYNVSLVSIKNY